ncbi:MAG: hypothetical protein IPN17_32050 [Deltaproteobacteria bacterium]|nr:hypothetical protein [Deltaproteobacteria bacterium]
MAADSARARGAKYPNLRTEVADAYRSAPSGVLLVLTTGGDMSVRAEPFEVVEFDLGPLWLW